MTSPLVFAVAIVLFVPATRSSEGTVTAQAIEEASEAKSVVIVRELSSQDQGGEQDAALVRASELSKSDGAVAMMFEGEDRTRLRLYVSATRSFSTRELEFRPGEPPLERARAAGYVIGSIFASAPARPSKESSESTPVPTTRSAAESPHPPARVAAVESLGAATVGVGGPASGVGGELAVRFRPTRAPGLWLRGGAGIVFGSVGDDSFEATTLRLRFGASTELATADRLGIAARVDVLGIRHAVLYGGQRGDHWVPAMAVLLDASLRIADTVAIVATAGPEIAFGSVRIFVGDALHERIPWLRVGGGVGARVTF